MSRSQFDTGQHHQGQVAIWVRRRLVDAKGVFQAHQQRTTQHGVILADGVGMGKTWEALAASGLLLVERSKSTKSGNKRLNRRRRLARVLVLCPPGLVSKWTREIRDPDGFRLRLEAWARKQRHRRGFVFDTLTHPFEIRSRADLPPMHKKGNHFTFPAGTYICNWNVLRKEVGAGYSRLAALRRQEWDIVIVDEAHHREAKAAIKNVKRYSVVGQMILLTATPFQLDPKELHALFGTVLDHRQSNYHKVLTRPPVKQFVRGLEAFFRGQAGPTKTEKQAAEHHLRQIVTRSRVPTKGRRYYSIDGEGSARVLNPPPDRRCEDELRDLRDSLTIPSGEFEAWYLSRRMELASCEGADRTFIPNKLRQALSTVSQARESLSGRRSGPKLSPKTESLAIWARRQITHDLQRFAKDGWPRKILVFTSFVGKAPAELQRRLDRAIQEAWETVRSGGDWKKMAGRAAIGLLHAQRQVESRLSDPDMVQVLERSRLGQRIVRGLRDLIGSLLKRKEPTLVRDLFGSRRFVNLVVDDLTRRLSVLEAVLTAEREERWQYRLHRDELGRLKANLRSLRRCRLVATYTGHDDRRDREASGEAFCSPLGPWILVASNVGSEGIDLQTYSAHLVHFDIEWNPARMEQREGRIDRVGRRLPDHVSVHYVLVQKTYDERMLHQLVARQRWHAVLLGRQGARLTKDNNGTQDARLLALRETNSLTLDLRPFGSRRRLTRN